MTGIQKGKVRETDGNVIYKKNLNYKSRKYGVFKRASDFERKFKIL